jgi:hypothetical protein
MTNEERRQLDEQGFVVLENCMGVDLLRQLREQISDISEVEGDRAGRVPTEVNATGWQTQDKGRGSAARSCCRVRSSACGIYGPQIVEQPERAFG